MFLSAGIGTRLALRDHHSPQREHAFPAPEYLFSAPTATGKSHTGRNSYWSEGAWNSTRSLTTPTVSAASSDKPWSSLASCGHPCQ